MRARSATADWCMKRNQPEAGSPGDWLRYAKSDLAIASQPAGPDVLRDTLCYHAQQTAEKSLKAVLVWAKVTFPRAHSIQLLMDLLPSSAEHPPEAEKLVRLTDYAFISRYPGEFEEASEEEWMEAVRLAHAALEWATRVVARPL